MMLVLSLSRAADKPDANAQSMVINKVPAKNTTCSPTDKQHSFLSSGVSSFAKGLDPDQN